jgi:hypothetical protein
MHRLAAMPRTDGHGNRIPKINTSVIDRDKNRRKARIILVLYLHTRKDIM